MVPSASKAARLSAPTPSFSCGSLCLIFAVVTLLVLIANPTIASAQSYQFGIPPFRSVTGGPETIDLSNLSFVYTIPVFSRPGRGKPFSINQELQGALWSQGYNAASQVQWTVSFPPPGSGSPGVNNGVGYVIFGGSATATCQTSYPYKTITYPTYSFPYYIDGTGTSHPIGILLSALTNNTGTCADVTVRYSETRSSSDASSDVSSVSASLSQTTGNFSFVVTLADGTVIIPPYAGASQYTDLWGVTATGVFTVTDSNGNRITANQNGMTSNTITDTLGTTLLTSNANSYSYTAPSGAAAKFTVNTATYKVQTAFNCPGVKEFPATQFTLVSGYTLPDGSSYAISYEPTSSGSGNVTGRIASVRLPTGGTISYKYIGGDSGTGIACADGTVAGFNRTTQDGTSQYLRSNFVVNPGETCGANPNFPCITSSTTTITDPLGNQTVMNFNGSYELQRQVYAGAATGTPLESRITCYNGATANCATSTSADEEPIEETNVFTSLNGGPQSRVDTFYVTYGSNLVTARNEYDFGATTPTRETAITYDTTLGNNITDKPSQVTVTDGSGNFLSQTNYTYDQDEAALVASGAPELSPVTCTAPSGHCRGNLTTLTSYVTGSTSLTKTFTHYDSGTVYQATDVNGAVTSYTYSLCGGSFAQYISLPLSLSESYTWNCGGGVKLSAMDANGYPSSVVYSDPYFWRPSSSTDQSGFTTTYTYTPISLESTLLFNGSQSASDTLTTMDGLDRTHIVQKRQTPGASNFDSTETDYAPLGMPARQTMPYVGTGEQTNSTAPSTTTQYDGLGRPLTVKDGGGGVTTYSYSQNDVLVTVSPAPAGENTKARQYQYDGLGRLTSVCEITAAAGSGSCGQIVSATGFLTTYTYNALGKLIGVSQNAQSTASQQTRAFTYDWLGRMTAETNPESGTTAYTYDTDSVCGASNGDLVKKVDAVGNVTCYAYDALHRKTSITYPSGPYSASTPSKTFIYDATTFSCTSPAGAFVKGRLAEAFTGPSSAKITDIAFCYSPRGEITDEFESTPKSAGYYHTTVAYWANGATETLSGVPTLSTWAFTPDGEGRPYSATYSTSTASTNWVASTAYYPSNPQTTVTFGNGDTDVYGYDPNTGRMNGYQFTVGATPSTVTGTVNWNANWTLGSLGISDQLNASDTQNCSYVYDDLARTNSVNCVNGSTTVWNQSFILDPFGNISKSGTSSFTALYLLANGTTNNQEQSVSGCVPAYDADGNLTLDCSTNAVYSWDADGNPINLGNTSLAYDALGREVQVTSGPAVLAARTGVTPGLVATTTYSEILYSPIGKLGVMNGQTVVTLRVPLPGGSIAELQPTSSGTQPQVFGSSSWAENTLHPDWLGSSRLETNYATRALTSDGAYAPFGENYAGYVSDLDFTGQFQNTLGGVYDFLYREYSPVQGRWISPDPAGMAAVNPNNPQSWNRYAYVGNDPLNQTDPSGTQAVCTSGGYARSGNSTARECGSSVNCILDGLPTPCSQLPGPQDEFNLLRFQAASAMNAYVQYDYGILPQDFRDYNTTFCMVGGGCTFSDDAGTVNIIGPYEYGLTGETLVGSADNDWQPAYVPIAGVVADPGGNWHRRQALVLRLGQWAECVSDKASGAAEWGAAWGALTGVLTRGPVGAARSAVLGVLGGELRTSQQCFKATF